MLSNLINYLVNYWIYIHHLVEIIDDNKYFNGLEKPTCSQPVSYSAQKLDWGSRYKKEMCFYTSLLNVASADV